MFKRWMPILILVLVASLIGSGAQMQVFALQAGNGPLSRMLAQVPDNALSRTVLRYGSLGDLERTLGVQINSVGDVDSLPTAQRAAYLLEIGLQVYYSPFSGMDHSPEWQQMLSIDSFAIDRELTIGAEQPQQIGILEGTFQSDAISTALQAQGYQAVQAGNATVYALDSGAQAAPLSLYRRLVLSPTQIIVAPSDALIQTVINVQETIGADPAYSALASALEASGTVPNTQLLSAALFGDSYLANLRGDAGWSPLPAYQGAGMGYRRGAQDRAWLIALVYSDANSAQQANAALVERLSSYASRADAGGNVFEYWTFEQQVIPVGQFQVAVVTMRAPGPTNVSWLNLINNGDVAFLATR